MDPYLEKNLVHSSHFTDTENVVNRQQVENCNIFFPPCHVIHNSAKLSKPRNNNISYLRQTSLT